MRRSLFLLIAASSLLVIAVVAVPALGAVGAGAPAVWTAVLVAMVIAVVISVLLARRIARPVKELGGAFRRFGSGDFGTRVMLGRRGELRDLGERFNEMAEQTRRLVTDLERQRAELDAVIGSIREGLVVLDRDGRARLANSSFRQIAATDDVAGRFHWELLRESGFTELVRQAGETARTVSGTVELSGRTYACSATGLAGTGETVVTLHDITAVTTSERMKRELVTNVSHELRTPLTAIQGYLETIEGAVSGDNRGYLEVIRRHTDRLTHLVQDLLALSELEETDPQLELSPVDLGLLAADVARLFESAARQKGLELRLQTPDQLLTVHSDRARIEQVLVNLVDNAIRFTDKGEVSVRVGRQDHKAVIEVRDTGCGIEEKHLSRLFERFYVVDKSRSRQTGGTGLGLAIVKHVVQLLGGSVAVESRPGVGSRFVVTLPTA